MHLVGIGSTKQFL